MCVQWQETFSSTTNASVRLRQYQDYVPAQLLTGAHRDMVSIHVFIGMGICMFV